MTVSNRPIGGYRKQGDVHAKLCRNAMSSTFCGSDRNLHLGDIAQGGPEDGSFPVGSRNFYSRNDHNLKIPHSSPPILGKYLSQWEVKRHLGA